MKLIKHLSIGFITRLALSALIVIPGCYTVLKESTDYYSEFDTDRKKTIKRDTLIVLNEWESEEPVSSDSETDEEVTGTGNKTVIINRFYNDPWYRYSWSVVSPYYHSYWGWGVSFGWSSWPVYYHPYWYYPYWRSGYYWGWCCYPVDPWYPWYPPYWWSGSSGGYSHYERRNYGMRRYQLNPVMSGGSGASIVGRSVTTSGSTQINEGQSGRRVYRDGSATVNEPKEETTKVSRSGNQRQYKSGESAKATGSKAQEKSKSNARRQYKEGENKDKNTNDKQAPRETRVERNSGSSSGNSGRDTRTENAGRSSSSGRDNNTGSSGRSGSDRSSGSSNSGGRSNDRPVRR